MHLKFAYIEIKLYLCTVKLKSAAHYKRFTIMKSYEVISQTVTKTINGREITFEPYFYCVDADKCVFWSNRSEGAKRFYNIDKAEQTMKELQETAPAGTVYKLVTCYANERNVPMDKYYVRVEIGKTIRNARKSKNMTQAELADKTGLSIQHIENVERNAFAPRVDILNRLCKALEIEITLPLK